VSYLEETAHLQDSVPALVYEYLPTAAGLALIPFIVKPLDSLVEKVLYSYVNTSLCCAVVTAPCACTQLLGAQRQRASVHGSISLVDLLSIL
jgi:hypothetical protein